MSMPGLGSEFFKLHLDPTVTHCGLEEESAPGGLRTRHGPGLAAPASIRVSPGPGPGTRRDRSVTQTDAGCY